MKLNPPATIIALIAAAFGYMAWQYEAEKPDARLSEMLKSVAEMQLETAWAADDPRLVYMGGVPKECEPPFGRLPNGLCAITLEQFRAFSPKHLHTFFGNGGDNGGSKFRSIMGEAEPEQPVARR